MLPAIHLFVGHAPALDSPEKDQNAYIERFNRTYREEVLDLYLFQSMTEVRNITASWLREYNHERPHDALGGMTPTQYATRVGA